MSPTSNKDATARRPQTRGPANAQAVLEAAHRLIREKGDDFTTQDLIREADVALQTFYRHFGSKDLLLIAIIGDLTTAHCEAMKLQAADLDDPIERLHFYVMETLSPLIGDPAASGARFMAAQHWRLYQNHPAEFTASSNSFTNLVQAELEAAIEAGLITSTQPAFDAWAVNKFVVAVFHHYAFADDDTLAATDGAAVAEQAWRFCLAAIGAPADRAPAPARRRALARPVRRK